MNVGLKDIRFGDIMVSELHAGFIVNKGNGTAKDLLAVIEHVKAVVKEKTGKEIILENEVLGED